MSQETTNPWDSGTAASSQAAPTSSGGADAWGTPDGSATPDAASSSDWLNSAPAPAPEHFNIMDPFHKTWIPLDHWVT
ncbi:proline/betaine ABC transporter permease ProW, partial [Pantoea agglomerans]|nr:proline/betaine ABC transporter permease ProW [Pantoea agglomerans]